MYGLYFFMETTNKMESSVSNSFKKEERLCSKKIIDKLFSEGASFLSFPIKVVYLPTTLPGKYPIQAGFSVSKKIFKRAVKRNRIKRLMREGYRLNKHILSATKTNNQMAVFFIFIGKDVPNYSSIEKAMKKALHRLSETGINSGDKRT